MSRTNFKNKILATGYLCTSHNTLSNSNIVLKVGEQKERHRGFGFYHIWEEHFSHISNIDTAIIEIISMLNDILQPGADVYDEGFLATKHDKYTISLVSKKSIIIFEKRQFGKNTEYSIVTCYSTRKIHGVKAGALNTAANLKLHNDVKLILINK